MYTHLCSKRKSKNRKKAKKKRKKWTKGRIALVGTATILGGAAIAFTGGLATPAIAGGIAGVSGVVGAGTAVASAGAVTAAWMVSTTGAAVITAMFGVAGAGLVGRKINHRVKGINDFEFCHVYKSKTEKCMQVILTVDGWLINSKKNKSNKMKNDETLIDTSESTPNKSSTRHFVDQTWKCLPLDLSTTAEVYNLQWETKDLKSFGNGLKNFIKNEAVGNIAAFSLKQTVFSSLMAGFFWPAMILKIADMIDNPWSVIVSRSEKAALVLADVIQSRLHGHRPLTLIGYSMGARLIFLALEKLSKEGGQLTYIKKDKVNETQKQKDESKNDVNGIIMDVILLGTPVPTNRKRWNNVRKIVSGRLINCYSSTDWTLNFLYRSTKTTLKVAGLSPVKVDFVENYDVKDVIGMGHHKYPENIMEILKKIDFIP